MTVYYYYYSAYVFICESTSITTNRLSCRVDCGSKREWLNRLISNLVVHRVGYRTFTPHSRVGDEQQQQQQQQRDDRKLRRCSTIQPDTIDPSSPSSRRFAPTSASSIARQQHHRRPARAHKTPCRVYDTLRCPSLIISGRNLSEWLPVRSTVSETTHAQNNNIQRNCRFKEPQNTGHVGLTLNSSYSKRKSAA